jgi:hypothetical protein
MIRGKASLGGMSDFVSEEQRQRVSDDAALPRSCTIYIEVRPKDLRIAHMQIEPRFNDML